MPVEIPPDPRPPLSWPARLLVGLVFAAGVALSIYGGLMFGMIRGIMFNADNPQPPTHGIGLAPDLTDTFNLFLDIGFGGLLGALLGLLLGSLVMWFLCRSLLMPLLRPRN